MDVIFLLFIFAHASIDFQLSYCYSVSIYFKLGTHTGSFGIFYYSHQIQLLWLLSLLPSSILLLSYCDDADRLEGAKSVLTYNGMYIHQCIIVWRLEILDDVWRQIRKKHIACTFMDFFFFFVSYILFEMATDVPHKSYFERNIVKRSFSG